MPSEPLTPCSLVALALVASTTFLAARLVVEVVVAAAPVVEPQARLVEPTELMPVVEEALPAGTWSCRPRAWLERRTPFLARAW